MRGHDVDELPRCNNLGSLPELWEVPLIASHQIVRASRVSTFQEFIIVGVFCDLQWSPNSGGMRTVPDKLKLLLLESSADSQLWARQYSSIFGENGV
jgi:hypothetical protein